MRGEGAGKAAAAQGRPWADVLVAAVTAPPNQPQSRVSRGTRAWGSTDICKHGKWENYWCNWSQPTHRPTVISTHQLSAWQRSSKGWGSKAGGTEYLHNVFMYKGILWWTIQCRFLALHHCQFSSTPKFLYLKDFFSNKSDSELVTLLYPKWCNLYCTEMTNPSGDFAMLQPEPKALILVTLSAGDSCWDEPRTDCSSCSETRRSEKPPALHPAQCLLLYLL